MPAILALTGIAFGLVGLALVSNRFGNTDMDGLNVVPIGGLFLATGICSLFTKMRYAIILGVVAGTLSLVLLFLAYWVAIFVMAAFN